MTSEIIFKIFHKKPDNEYSYSELYRKYLLRKVNKDIEERLRYFHVKGSGNKDVLAFIEMPSGKIIAATGMAQTSMDKNTIFTHFISVDPDYRKMGFGRKLVRARFQLMRDKYPGKILEISTYTPMGDLFIRPAIHEISKEFPDVILKDYSYDMSYKYQYRDMLKALEERRSFVDISEFD
jgi:predicted GNAT family N-acyltransferase